MIEGTLRYASQLAQGVVSVWFVSWALRRRYELDYELDYKLDRGEQILRWTAIAVAFALALLPGSRLAMVRVVSWVSGIAYLAWPNLAHRTVEVADRLRVSKRNQS